MNMFKSLAVLVSLLFVGCATHIAAFVPAQPSDEKGSVMYVYRSSEASSMMLAPDIEIRDVEGKQTTIGALAQGEYRLIYLQPGQYEMRLDAIEYYAPGNKLMVEVMRDTVNYLRLDSSLKFETGLSYKAYVRRFNLQEVKAPVAMDEIASCVDVGGNQKMINNTVDDVNGSASGKDNGAHFTTDKTTDPFSRNQ